MFVNYKCNLSYYNTNTYTRNKPGEGRVFHYPFSHLVSVAINSFEILPLMWILVTDRRKDGWMDVATKSRGMTNHHQLSHEMFGSMDGWMGNQTTLKITSFVWPQMIHFTLCPSMSSIVLCVLSFLRLSFFGFDRHWLVVIVSKYFTSEWTTH